VEDLGPVLAEIHRVLKPGGVVLSLFPDKGVWREPHCGIPFLHWFPKGSRWRYYYAFFMRTIGLGSHKNQRTRTFWSEHFCEYLDKWTHYRTRTEIENLYDRHFREIHYLENRYFMKRLENRPMVTFIPPAIRRFIVRKHAGVVFTARKPEHEFAGVRLDQLG
jgi:SAM-dependent methyltransferase